MQPKTKQIVVIFFVQRQHNNEQLAQLKIQQSGGKDVQDQIDTLNQSNQTISQQLQQNANQGSITINSAHDVNILASQNTTNNYESYQAMNMMYSIQDNHDLQIATTVSPLLSSNNITINADGGNGNINLLSAILTGQGNLDLNGNVSIQSLQDIYYQYDFSQATSMNLGALLGMLLAAVVIGAVTGGVGTGILGSVGMSAAVAQVGMMAAIMAAAGTSALGALAGVGIQMGITAAIDSKNGGAAATQAMQSGHMDSTTKQYQAMVGSSLLFGGGVNTSSSNNSIDSATYISSSNLNQTADNQESALFKEEHKTIGPDWNQLMTDAAINGVVAGTTVVASDFLTWYTKFKPTWAVAEGDAVNKPSAELISDNPGKWANPNVINPHVPNVGLGNYVNNLAQVGNTIKAAETIAHEGSWLLKGLAKGIPGFNYMSVFHDLWAGFAGMGNALTVLSIAPAIPITYLALGGYIFSGIGTGVVNGENSN